MKKIIFSVLICTLLSCQENRPHGNQYNLPELTPNNLLIGNLNEYRSSYRVSFYDINIDFDIDNKSLNGFVTVKAESIKDLDRLQIDLADADGNTSITCQQPSNGNIELKVAASTSGDPCNGVPSANGTDNGGQYDLPTAVADQWCIGVAAYNLATWLLNFGGYTTISISSAETDANGYGTFEYAPPSGYYALCTKNLAEYG